MSRSLRTIAIMMAVLMLAGCKVELYRGLGEEEANEMLSLLIARNVASSKSVDKNGAAQIEVEESQFAEAVELLRQNGFPKGKDMDVTEVFPSGQLVSSPVQEHAKIAFLREQGIERMLSAMDGVMAVRVRLSDPPANPDGSAQPSSASVFIKYSPQDNLRNSEEDIKRLVLNGVPNLRPESITVVLQPAPYRFISHARPSNAIPWWIEWVRLNSILVSVIGAGILAVFALAAGLVQLLRKGRSQ